MFKQKTVKAFSIVAIILSGTGLLICVLGAVLWKQIGHALAFLLGIVSWTILLWASIIGYKLCTTYKLYEDEYRKIGIRIYLIIVSFMLFLFVGFVIGLIISVVLLAALWGLKRNYDEWENKNLRYAPGVKDSTETTNPESSSN